MPRRLVQLIVIATVVRMMVALVLEFGNDEVYYFLYALDLQPNYFDHPPGVAWLIRLSTLNLLLTDEFFVRLGAIACSALGTALIYKLGTRLKNEQTGWYAAILYTSNLYTSLIAGSFIIPDSPQVVAWLASLLVMFDILATPTYESVPRKLWLQFGLLSGIAILCKVHGVFLWVSLGLFILLYERRHLTDRNLYLGALVTALVISPILIWNFQNDFITYRFHSERVEVSEAWLHFDYFFQAIGGQFVYSNPVVAALILVAAWKLKRMEFMNDFSQRFIWMNGLPLVAVVTLMALFNPMLPHWSGPAMMVLMLLPAAWLDERKTISESAGESRLLTSSAITVGVLVLIAVLVIHVYPGTFGSQVKNEFGDDDFTLDLSGWSNFSDDFGKWLNEEETSGRLQKNLPIVSNKWFPAAHIEYYVARPLNRPVIGVGRVVDLHQYNWLNLERPTLQPGDSALCIIPSNYHMILHESYYRNFTSIDMVKVFYSYRGGKMSRYFTVYLLMGYKGNDEAHQPPFAPKK